jgi:hypothetical protein
MVPAPQADAVPVCIAITMADVDSIELYNLTARPARSVSSGAMDAVARTLKTTHLSQRGPMLRADARTPGARPIGSQAWTLFCLPTKLRSSPGGLIGKKGQRSRATRATWRSQSHPNGTKFLCPSVNIAERGRRFQCEGTASQIGVCSVRKTTGFGPTHRYWGSNTDGSTAGMRKIASVGGLTSVCACMARS